MLTGMHAFKGEDMTDTLANVLRAEPDWTAVPTSVPEPLRTLMRRCLEKEYGARSSTIRAKSSSIQARDPATSLASSIETRGSPSPRLLALWLRA
jgi:hypothetical protein